MTNEDYIIEILLKAEKLGVREDVLKEVSKDLEENPTQTPSQAYDLSFKKKVLPTEYRPTGSMSAKVEINIFLTRITEL